MLAGPAPEVLIGPIAAATRADPRRQRRRDAPALLPLKVAEAFSLLAGLFPGPDRPRPRPRVGHGPDDAPSRSSATAARPRRTTSSSSSWSCSAYLDGTLPADHPFARLAARCPALPEAPEPWLLGSSPQSAIWAAQLGLPYAFADFINRDGASIAADYQRRFDPGRARRRAAHRRRRLGARRGHREEAWELTASSRMAMAMLRRGRLIPVPPVEQALRFLEAQGRGLRGTRRITAGTPEQVRAGSRRSRSSTAPTRSSSSRSPTTTPPGGGPTSCWRTRSASSARRAARR